MQVIEVHTNFTNTAKGDFTLTLDDLLTAEGLARLRAVFTDPERLRPRAHHALPVLQRLGQMRRAGRVAGGQVGCEVEVSRDPRRQGRRL